MIQFRINIKYCINCLYPGEWLCHKCYSQLIRQPLSCYMCNKISNYGVTHKECLVTKNLINSNLFLFTYNSIAKRFLKFSKFRSGFRSLPFIVDKEIRQISEYLRKIENPILIPVPIHWMRLFKRGYNQSQIISERISLHTNIPTEQDLLIRKSYRKPQTHVQKKLRAENVKGVFSLNRKLARKYVNRNIVLIDDVRTTGSTINECAKAIKEEIVSCAVHTITLFSPKPKFSNKMLIPNRNRKILKT